MTRSRRLSPRRRSNEEHVCHPCHGRCMDPYCREVIMSHQQPKQPSQHRRKAHSPGPRVLCEVEFTGSRVRKSELNSHRGTKVATPPWMSSTLLGSKARMSYGYSKQCLGFGSGPRMLRGWLAWQTLPTLWPAPAPSLVSSCSAGLS